MVLRFRDVSFLPRTWVDRGRQCQFLYRVIIPQALQQRIPVNYTSDMQEYVEVTAYANEWAEEKGGRQTDGEDEVNRLAPELLLFF